MTKSKIINYRKAYYRKHKKQINKVSVEWRRANPERVKASTVRWRRENPSVFLWHNAKNRAKR